MDLWVISALKEGGMFALACVSIWILNKVWKDRLAEAERNAKAEHQTAEDYKTLCNQIQKVVEDNTRVIAVFIDRTQPLPRVRKKTENRE